MSTNSFKKRHSQFLVSAVPFAELFFNCNRNIEKKTKGLTCEPNRMLDIVIHRHFIVVCIHLSFEHVVAKLNPKIALESGFSL